MNLKTLLPIIVISVIGVVIASFFAGNVLLSQSIAPFESIQTESRVTSSDPSEAEQVVIPLNESNTFNAINPFESNSIRFVHNDLLEGWVPWIIRQVSILIGALSLIVFVYAGVSLIVRGDNEEELAKSTKMIVFGILGIALAGLSYSIVANVLALL